MGERSVTDTIIIEEINLRSKVCRQRLQMEGRRIRQRVGEHTFRSESTPFLRGGNSIQRFHI